MADDQAGGDPGGAESIETSVLNAQHAQPLAFFQRPVEEVARDLLGCLLVSERDEGTAAGMIVETEAYGGVDDPASHAAFRRNGAVRTMWGPAGRAYVYVAYGVYPCFNTVTGEAGVPQAVLIRAVAPLVGQELMARRLPTSSKRKLASGPGKLSLALGISPADNGLPLDAPPIWIQPGAAPGRDEISVGPRVGVTREAARPWRFGIARHPALSRPFPKRLPQ